LPSRRSFFLSITVLFVSSLAAMLFNSGVFLQFISAFLML
jgi:hypothetical protein